MCTLTCLHPKFHESSYTDFIILYIYIFILPTLGLLGCTLWTKQLQQHSRSVEHSGPSPGFSDEWDMNCPCSVVWLAVLQGSVHPPCLHPSAETSARCSQATSVIQRPVQPTRPWWEALPLWHESGTRPSHDDGWLTIESVLNAKGQGSVRGHPAKPPTQSPPKRAPELQGLTPSLCSVEGVQWLLEVGRVEVLGGPSKQIWFLTQKTQQGICWPT